MGTNQRGQGHSIRPEPESPARGLRRTAVARAPRATSTPPRAALPRLASYNGGTVGRASRARLSTPRQPTPLLSGTCLTSAGRPPLRGMLATEGPGHLEGYPGPVEARYALSELRRIPIPRTPVNKARHQPDRSLCLRLLALPRYAALLTVPPITIHIEPLLISLC